MPVMDNLNTHTIACLYGTFAPDEEAKRIKDRLEIHYTPKHGAVATDTRAGTDEEGGGGMKPETEQGSVKNQLAVYNGR
jgi:hypothetical protein